MKPAYAYIKQVTKIIGLLAAAFFIVFGALYAFFPLKPFWLDEWFIIDNIKFKEPAILWGQLDHMQQFPRMYLQLLKQVAQIFDYSYSSLRVPSFIVMVCAVLLTFSVGKKLFRQEVLSAVLWMLIFMSYKTSLHYFVQIKQYTMEMLLGVVAIWQMYRLFQLMKGAKSTPLSLMLLFVSVGLAPFFSYTYPIVLAPMFVVVILRMVTRGRQMNHIARALSVILLLTSALSVSLFYLLDVRYVLQDEGMQNYWQDHLMLSGFNAGVFFQNMYQLFAGLGAGGLFEVVFAVLGIGVFVTVLARFKRNIKSDEPKDIIAVYGVMLVLCVTVLFLAGKLPVGVHRLNAFAMPALAFMVVYLIRMMEVHKKLRVVSMVLLPVLILAQAGNIVSSYLSERGSDEYKTKLAIYENVTKGISKAQERKLPLIVNREITYPHHVHPEITGDWVVRTYPAYDAALSLKTYPVDEAEQVSAILKEKSIDTAMYINASSYEIVITD